MPRLLDRLASFQGTMPHALIHNWLLVAKRDLPGPRIGVTVDVAHQPVGLDLDLFKEYGLIETKSIGIIGRQGFGKTFLMYLLLLFITGTDLGKRSSSILLHSRKRNNQARPETAPLIEDVLGCKVANPRTMGLNPLSRAVGMTFTEQFVWLVNVINLALGRADGVTTAMRDVLKKMLSIAWDSEGDPSIPGLRALLRDYVPEGLHPVKDEEETSKDLLARNPEVFEQAALELYLALGIFEEDEFLGLFDSQHSTFEEIEALLTQRGVSVDLKNLTAKARSALSITWSAITTSAMSPADDDPDGPAKYPERIPAAIGVDEAYADWGNPVVATALYEDAKTQRERGITTINAFHRFRDLKDAIPDPGAQKMAANSVNEIEVWFIFRQGSDEDVRYIDAHFGNRLPRYVLDDLTRLKKGFCWMIIPNQSPVLVMVMGTAKAVQTFNTEGAHHALLERWYRTGNPKDYAQYLEETTPEDEPETTSEEVDHESKVGSA